MNPEFKKWLLEQWYWSYQLFGIPIKSEYMIILNKDRAYRTGCYVLNEDLKSKRFIRPL